MELIYIVAGLLIGALMAVLFMRKSISEASSAILKEKDDRIEELKSKVSMLEHEAVSVAEANRKYVDAVREGAAAELDKARLSAMAEMDKVRGEAKDELEQLREEYERKLSAQRLEFEEKERQNAKQRKLEMDESLKTVEARLHGITESLLKRRAEELEKDNKESMGGIINPLKIYFEEMKKDMKSNRETYAMKTAEITKHIELMSKTSQDVGQEANRLADALQKKPKLQGDFGEMRLEMLLERFGFKEGLEFDREVPLIDQDGKQLKNEDTNQTMRPDVILHYPDDKDLIIDAKMSLSAYVDYVNAENPDDKQRALNSHLKSVRAHVKELQVKDYSRYLSKTRTTMDFVVMFVPHEGALITALANDPELWKEAFDAKVFITGEQNLFAVLKLLQMAWTQKSQTDNQRRIIELAEKFVDRAGDFVERFHKFGADIDRLKDSFNSAEKKLIKGRQSLYGPVYDLVDVGVKQGLHALPQREESSPLEILGYSDSEKSSGEISDEE